MEERESQHKHQLHPKVLNEFVDFNENKFDIDEYEHKLQMFEEFLSKNERSPMKAPSLKEPSNKPNSPLKEVLNLCQTYVNKNYQVFDNTNTKNLRKIRNLLQSWQAKHGGIFLPNNNEGGQEELSQPLVNINKSLNYLQRRSTQFQSQIKSLTHEIKSLEEERENLFVVLGNFEYKDSVELEMDIESMSQSMEFKNGSEYVKGKLKEMNQLLPVVRKYTQICSKLHASMDLLTETKSFYNDTIEDLSRLKLQEQFYLNSLNTS